MINIGNVVAGSDGLNAGVNSTYFYFRSTGYLIPSVTGLYTVGCNASDGVNIFIGTQSLVHNLTGSDVANATLKYTQSGTIMLTAGVYYPLTVEWQHGGGANYELQLMWTLPVSGGPAVTAHSQRQYLHGEQQHHEQHKLRVLEWYIFSLVSNGAGRRRPIIIDTGSA